MAADPRFMQGNGMARATGLFELSARTNWTLGRIAQLIDAGRQASWLNGGDDYPVIDGKAILAECDARLGMALTPMRALQVGLRLDNHEVDLLWSLACVELEPRLTRAIQPLRVPDATSVSVQLAERLVLDDPELEGGSLLCGRLIAGGLLEVIRDERTGCRCGRCGPAIG